MREHTVNLFGQTVTIVQNSNGKFTVPEEIKLWTGYGSAIKPSHEPIVLAMKPISGTFAQNALEYGVAGLNIDECRVGFKGDDKPYSYPNGAGGSHGNVSVRINYTNPIEGSPLGRWPANLILSHHSTCNDTDCHPLCPVRLLDEQAGDCKTGKLEPHHRLKASENLSMSGSNQERNPRKSFGGDSGGASRFFYCAKVSTRERNLGNTTCLHPTLKPIDLTRYLSTLLLPPPHSDYSPRRLLVPFSGAGSEIAGATLSGWDYIHGIEFDPEHIRTSHFRVKGAMVSMASTSLRSQKSDVKVIHSSLSHVLTLGIDSEFPGYPASIGVLLERSRTSSNSIHLLSHAPKLSSIETGELLDLTSDSDDLDTRLRSELLSQAKMCDSLAADLLSHAERLRLEARKETLIHDSEGDTIETFPLNPPGKNRAKIEPSDDNEDSILNLSAFDD